jgi:hypothetical protein
VHKPIVHIEEKNFVKSLFYCIESELMESFTEIVFAKQNDAQAQGSGITYARRYGLQSLFVLVQMMMTETKFQPVKIDIVKLEAILKLVQILAK